MTHFKDEEVLPCKLYNNLAILYMAHISGLKIKLWEVEKEIELISIVCYKMKSRKNSLSVAVKQIIIKTSLSDVDRAKITTSDKNWLKIFNDIQLRKLMALKIHFYESYLYW